MDISYEDQAPNTSVLQISNSIDYLPCSIVLGKSAVSDSTVTNSEVVSSTVSSNSEVSNYSRVSNYSTVSWFSKVFSSEVSDRSEVSNYSIVSDRSEVLRGSTVLDGSVVSGHSKVAYSTVSGKSIVLGSTLLNSSVSNTYLCGVIAKGAIIKDGALMNEREGTITEIEGYSPGVIEYSPLLRKDSKGNIIRIARSVSPLK